MDAKTRRVSAHALVAFLAALATSQHALAWGDEGHEVVALIALDRLDPAVREKIDQLLATDSQSFAMRDGRQTNASFGTQATWADYFRESQGHFGDAYKKTHQWHFADIEIHGGSLSEACFDFPGLAAGVPAFDGDPDDCVVDKISQFKKELAEPSTSPTERLLALKFLLHFVGDVHQPLHASDDNDVGGNGKSVSANGVHAGKLHHYWDTEFVLKIPAPAATPVSIAKYLAGRITTAKAQQWSSADPKTWARESYAIGKRKAYGALPTPTKNKTGTGVTYRLDDDYVADAVDAVQGQLSKAGVRLANLLNEALQGEH
jgi:hypothetical protein